MKAPVKPIPVSNDEQRSILHWAIVGLGHELTRLEDEMARHKVMTDLDRRHADTLVVLAGLGYVRPRHERMLHVEEFVGKYQKLLRKLHALKQQADSVKMEEDTEGIVDMVRANRRAEKKAADDGKVVGEG